jgi:hypothetical protein
MSDKEWLLELARMYREQHPDFVNENEHTDGICSAIAWAGFSDPLVAKVLAALKKEFPDKILSYQYCWHRSDWESRAEWLENFAETLPHES